MENSEGLRVGTQKRASSKTKDRNPEGFWSTFDDVVLVCKLRAQNPKRGKAKIANYLKAEHLRTNPEPTVQRYYDSFIFDLEESALFK